MLPRPDPYATPLHLALTPSSGFFALSLLRSFSCLLCTDALARDLSVIGYFARPAGAFLIPRSLLSGVRCSVFGIASLSSTKNLTALSRQVLLPATYKGNHSHFSFLEARQTN